MCCPQASPHVCISKLSENAILVVCRSRTSGIRWIFLSLLLVALWHAHANNNFVVFSIGLIVVIALAWFKLTETQEEHVLYLRGIGYQLKRKTRMGLQRGNFFAADRLQSVVIHEGFESCAVLYYVAFLSKETDRMMLLFPTLRPNLKDCLRIRNMFLKPDIAEASKNASADI